MSGKISGAYNLIGIDTGLSGISNGSNGNQIGTAASPIDPKIGPLANNGGSTLTHALLAGSPAINAGSNALATCRGAWNNHKESNKQTNK